MLKKITYDEAAEIYKRWLVKHFPANEVKPLINIKNMWEISGYEAYCLYEDNHLIGYAYLCQKPSDNYILLDYLAIIDEYRGKGYGSKILSGLKEIYSDLRAVIIETEDLNKAETPAETLERTRRDRFYTGNGIIKSGITATVYSADYRVWYMPIGEPVSEEDLEAAYDRIYEFMLSDKGYRDFFSIYNA